MTSVDAPPRCKRSRRKPTSIPLVSRVPTRITDMRVKPGVTQLLASLASHNRWRGAASGLVTYSHHQHLILLARPAERQFERQLLRGSRAPYNITPADNKHPSSLSHRES